jgi:uncharacterized protein (TIGR00251 family)
MNLKETKNGIIIEVFVKTKQPKFKVKQEGNEIVVFCTEEPVKGKVNKELIKELSKLFRAKIEMISGLTSKQKLLIIRNISKSNVETLLHTCFERTK